MKNLAKLLDQPERLVKRSINKLERLNGYPSEDARLLAQNSQATRQKIIELGLDPEDTTGEELYQALIAKFQRDSLLLDKAFGLRSNSSIDKRLSQAVRLVASIAQPSEIWVLKPNSAKNLLRSQPPKKILKQLNYRSLESLLKHENIAELYLALPQLESASWRKAFGRAAAQLGSTEYELRAPTMVAMHASRWAGINGSDQPFTTDNLIGAVGLWPANDQPKVPLLSLALMLMDGLEQLTHSTAETSLAQINPSLLWWEQSKHLIAICTGQAVSLNYKDIAIDHLQAVAYKKRHSANAQATLWQELMARYQNQTEQIERAALELQTAGTAQLDKLTTKSPAKNLAVEYAEAIAHEF